MEMHLFQRHMMGERLCFRYDVEHLARQCFRRVCHVCRVDDAHDLCQMASVVVVMLMVMMRLFASVSVTMRRFLIMMAVTMRRFLVLMAMAVMCFLLRSCRADRRRAIEVGHIMVMIFMGCIQNDIEITARNAGFLDAGDLHHETVCGNGIQRAFQRLRVCAEVDHRCDEHISADAGGSFKV